MTMTTVLAFEYGKKINKQTESVHVFLKNKRPHVKLSCRALNGETTNKQAGGWMDN